MWLPPSPTKESRMACEVASSVFQPKTLVPRARGKVPENGEVMSLLSQAGAHATETRSSIPCNPNGEVRIMVPEINWWAVILATLSSMVIGSVWYMPKVFGAWWEKAARIEKPANGLY